MDCFAVHKAFISKCLVYRGIIILAIHLTTRAKRMDEINTDIGVVYETAMCFAS